MDIQKECVEYLNQPGFQRFNQAWIDKYRSLGHLGGQIKLTDLSFQEQETIGLFLGMDLTSGNLSLSYSQFQKALRNTKFENVDFLEVLKRLQTNPLYTKREIQNFRDLKVQCFQKNFLFRYMGTKAYQWLADYFDKEKLLPKYIHYYPQFEENLNYICMSLNHLPIYQKKYELLPVFAYQITKDPHYFDRDFTKGLLLKGISFQLCQEEPKSIESINEILFDAGLLRDDLSNNCYICHIKPVEYNLGWQGFYDLYEPWNMNLYNLTQIQSDFEKMPIYIIENPSVFRSLCEFIRLEHKNIGLICSNGQINLCTYVLLDHLIKSGCQLFYAGDFDPEGLMIADKLKQRYPSLSLWCYNHKYLQDIAIIQNDISKNRVQILKNIQHLELKKIADCMLETNCFGYQEGLIDKYKQNLK